MRCSTIAFTAAFLALSVTGNAAVISFNTDPFAGSDALTTPGRQIVGGEPSISFSIASDVFSFDPTVFGISQILFANDVASNLPTTDVNVVVLQTIDNDDDPTTPFLAGTAANLIAAQITSPGPGLFVYFNSNLNLPRLVYSTDLSENTSDLAVLARMINLEGQSDELSAFTASNFAVSAIPEPSSFVLLTVAGAFWAVRRRLTRG